MVDYRSRHAEAKLRRLAKHFKAVLVTGARQVGKSTLLAHALPGTRTVVFDPHQDLHGAREDPDLFLDTFEPPIVLDEIQYAPELLGALKRRVDTCEAPGQYFLSGSQNLAVLRDVAESMAGRVGVLHLEGMTPQEAARAPDAPSWVARYLDDPDGLLDTLDATADIPGGLVRHLWRGSLPGILDMPDDLVPDYMSSYVRTYLERDVRVMGEIRDLSTFSRFLGLNAALTAQEINDAQIGREVGVSSPTARRWREVLMHSYQWREIAPFHGNVLKRLSGKRKGHLTDTGLACHLQRISSPEALHVSPLLGALFESWVTGFVFKQLVRMATPPQNYHWRTAGGAEVDLVLERDGKLFPIEVKCRTTLSGHDARGIRAFRDTYGPERVATGVIVYAGAVARAVNRHTVAVPWNAL